jgi:hypothetical protein
VHARRSVSFSSRIRFNSPSSSAPRSASVRILQQIELFAQGLPLRTRHGIRESAICGGASPPVSGNSACAILLCARGEGSSDSSKISRCM